MTGAFGAEEELPNASCSQPRLFASKKHITLGNEKDFIHTVDRPLKTGRGIFFELDCHLRAESHLDEGTVVFLTENKIRHTVAVSCRFVASRPSASNGGFCCEGLPNINEQAVKPIPTENHLPVKEYECQKVY